MVVATGLVGTGLALLLDPALYERFLLLIGSVFCPLFGVVLADYFLLRRGVWPGELPAGIRLRGVGAWLAGVLVYHALSRWAPALGASLPALLFSAVLYLAVSGRSAPEGADAS